ncbi:UNVERIFIED_CONTAM: ArsR family transcriptional regulator [Williamsia faeni]
MDDGAALAFEALADPIRREILSILADVDECSAGALADQITTVGRTAVSNHLRLLRVAGLVAERKQGRFRFYSVDSSGSAAQVLTLLQDVFQASLSPMRTAVESKTMPRAAEAG